MINHGLKLRCVFALLSIVLSSGASTDVRRTQSGFVEVGGDQIYFESTGSGQAVVLSHGAGGHHGIWMYQTPVLATQYRVITWDQRGWGRSTNHDGIGGSHDTAVADLKALLDHLGVEEAHVVGQSMGGWAVAGFAIDYPDQTLSLTLANTFGGLATADMQKMLTPEANEARMDEWRVRMAAAGREPGSTDNGYWTEPTIVDPERAFQYGQIRRLAPNRVVTGKNDYVFEDEADKLKQVAALDLPVLIITGTYDPIFEPRLMQKLHNALPNSTLHEIKDSGHSPYFERPEIWNQLVLDHFAESR